MLMEANGELADKTIARKRVISIEYRKLIFIMAIYGN
jgi:hypothetical protein